MSAAAPHSAPSNRALRRQRIGLVLGFWLAGLGVFTLRHLLAMRLDSESGTSRQWVELSEGGRLWLTLIPIACSCGALAMQICWLPAWGRVLSWTVSILFVPLALLITWAIVDLGPHKLDSVVANGHQYVLAVGGYSLGESLVLYEVGDVAGLSWRKVGDLFDPTGDALRGDEHLVVSPDGRWLLFARGGLWLDCFRLVGGRAIQAEIDVDLPGNGRALEFDTRRRSGRIAALTGLRP